MSSVATTNRSEMWNNCVEVNNDEVKQARHYGYRQYPIMSHYYNYQNNFHSQNCDYSNVASSGYVGKSYGSGEQSDHVVKSEPANWQGYPPADYMNGNSHANMQMINKWREISYYAQQQHESYGYEDRLNRIANQNSLDKAEDVQSINSPGQCSIPDTSYGSPQSMTSTVKAPTPEEDDSPNLRALLTKSRPKKTQAYFVKCDKTYKQEMLQRMMFQGEVEDWEKNETEPDKECNLSQFHGGFENGVEGQASIKTKGAVGGALPIASQRAPSSSDGAEPCQDMTRVEAGGDNSDYVENKMAAAPDAQTFYPWMKGVGGMFTNTY